MTVRRFCDACGTEIERSYTSERLEAERTFKHDGKRVVVKVECLVSVNGTANDGDVCRDCVIDTVDQADTRPQAMQAEAV